MCSANQLGEKKVLFPDRQQQSKKEEKKKLRSAEFRFACFLGQMMRMNKGNSGPKKISSDLSKNAFVKRVS